MEPSGRGIQASNRCVKAVGNGLPGARTIRRRVSVRQTTRRRTRAQPPARRRHTRNHPPARRRAPPNSWVCGPGAVIRRSPVRCSKIHKGKKKTALHICQMSARGPASPPDVGTRGTTTPPDVGTRRPNLPPHTNTWSAHDVGVGDNHSTLTPKGAPQERPWKAACAMRCLQLESGLWVGVAQAGAWRGAVALFPGPHPYENNGKGNETDGTKKFLLF